MIKVGNTQFNEKSIARMSFKDFEKTYSKILKGIDVKDAYETLTKKSIKDDKLG